MGGGDKPPISARRTDQGLLDTAEVLLECRDVTVSYGAGSTSSKPLAGVSLSVRSGESLAVMGPSGSGKSTLLRVMAGLQPPNHGQVYLNARKTKLPALRARQLVNLIHQDYRLVPFLSASENIQLALELTNQAAGADMRAGNFLRIMGLSGFESRLPGTLSGGEQQRVAIARALANSPTVLLADEPTGALDRAATSQIAQMLSTLACDEGLAVVVATHDPNVAAQLSRTIYLEHGMLRSAT